MKIRIKLMSGKIVSVVAGRKIKKGSMMWACCWGWKK